MPRPSADVEWATDANFSSPGDAWDGQPTKAAPTAPEQAQGFEPTQRLPAEYLNYLWNNFADGTTYLRELFDVGDERTYPAGARSRTVYLPAAVDAVSGLTGSAVPTWIDSLTLGGLDSNDDNARCRVSLASVVPSDCVITAVHALVKPGAARAASARMELILYRIDTGPFPGGDVTQTQIGSTIEDDGTTNRQRLSLSGQSELVTRDTRGLFARVQAGNTGGTSTDVFYGLEVVFNDPGPRNF